MKNRKFILNEARILSFADLLKLIMFKVFNRTGAIIHGQKRFLWTYRTVIDATGPELIIRNYLEWRDLRNLLEFVKADKQIKKAADIGCGFGRMAPILKEYAEEVVGFEREPMLVDTARSLNIDLKFIRIEDLAKIPCPDSEFDFVLIFTVLQHLPDTKAFAVIEEVKRITRSGGYALFCEQTDESDTFGDITSEHDLIQRGRDIAVYEEWMYPFKLVKILNRTMEPTYRRKNAGSYMLFNNSL